MNKKIFVFIIIIALVIGCITFFVIKGIKKASPEEPLNEFVSFLKEKDYSSMYSLLSSESKNNINETDFIQRNKNIYEGINATNYDLKINSTEEQEDKSYKINYNVSMDTDIGKIEFSSSSIVVKNKETKKYDLNWSSNFIYPNLNDTDKIRVKTIPAERGRILDRNNVILAGKGNVSSIGIVPGKLSENKDSDLQKLSELLDVSVDSINKSLSASYVKDDTFVEIKKMSSQNQELKDKLLQIKGVMITSTQDRIYPLAEATSHLVGYVQNVTAEDLEKNPDKGYTQNSVIGKSGLEKQYEDELRGKDGKEIYIENENGERKETLGVIDVQNGKDIKLTIDSKIQVELYNSIKDNKGFFVVMHPKTGELLALVSTPSYDNNEFIYGMGTEKWNSIKNNENNPLLVRYTRTYCPGSTFKPITAAIGLTLGKLTEEDTFSYNGLSWQKDKSWGDYYVTTLTAYSGAKNIKNALIHSDNIFFAQAALKIGNKDFVQGLKNIGFGEVLNLNLGISTSQIANDGNIDTDVGLADSGYGQAQLLVNPVHMASIYSAFVNNGNMIKPYLIYEENKEPTILKENAFSKEAANIVKNDLIQVIENPEGTATDMKISGITLAGKTGTAELKQSKTDEANTLGWFDLITVDENTDKQYIVISMVEEARDLGGSHYLINKIRELFK